jgi:formate dehydrogenase gamma subunit
MRLALAIDLERCVGCQACASACKEQWDSGPGAGRATVRTLESGTRGKDLAVTHFPSTCMQCEDHPCTLDCPTGATHADARTGVVVVDAAVCIGCGNCVSRCPYGARHVDPVKKVVEKCDLCAAYVARGEQPACVQTCPAECRLFGDLDDAAGPLAAFARERGARPLVTAEVNVRPKTLYAGDAERARVLAAGVVRAPEESWLTRGWGVTRPVASQVVPAVGLAFVGGGLLVNLKARRERVAREEGKPTSTATPTPTPTATAPRAATQDPSALSEAVAQRPRSRRGATLPRHRLGMRALHWFNAASWLVLLATGIALLSADSFALFGTRFPAWAAAWLGGAAGLLRAHVLWGLAWAALIVPAFLVFKKGAREVLQEVRLTGDDLRWLALKPLALAGVWRKPLPPQDKYNGGQKLFAVFVLVATTVIMASGVVMTFHLGPAWLVSAAILAHGAAIALAVAGVAVHFTMAAVMAEERPALRSMVTGHIDYHHAKHHSPKWVERLDDGRHRGDAE